MVTIDKLDIAIYIQYARRTQIVEQINQQYHLEQASSIPPQIQMIDFYPKLNEMDILLGVVAMHTPWAHFYPPQRFRIQRRSPFTFSRIIPSLGTQDEQDQGLASLESTICETPEEEKEKKSTYWLL